MIVFNVSVAIDQLIAIVMNERNAFLFLNTEYRNPQIVEIFYVIRAIGPLSWVLEK